MSKQPNWSSERQVLQAVTTLQLIPSLQGIVTVSNILTHKDPLKSKETQHTILLSTLASCRIACFKTEFHPHDFDTQEIDRKWFRQSCIGFCSATRRLVAAVCDPAQVYTRLLWEGGLGGLCGPAAEWAA